MNDIVNPAAAGNVARAVELARLGYRVFPVQPANRDPYGNATVAAALGIPTPAEGEGGCKLAVDDPDKAARLFSAFPAARIGIATGRGLVALDVDMKEGKDGAATLQEQGRWPPPDTFWQKTQSGGWHFLYRCAGPAPNDVEKLGSGLDRRGDGGYIIDYDLPLVPFASLPFAPDWLTHGAIETAGNKRENGGRKAPDYQTALRALQSIDPNDLERNDWLLLSGAFYTATENLPGADRALDDWQEWNLAYDGNDPAGNARTWHGFARSLTNGDATTLAKMCNDPDATARLLGLGAPVAMPVAQIAPSRSVDWFTPADLVGAPPEQEWLVKDMIPGSNVTLLYGDGGTGKSLLALQLAAAVAGGGLMWLNRCPKPGRALYLSAEDDRAELHRRLARIARQQGLPLEAFANLTVASLAGDDALLAAVNRDGTLTASALYREIESKVVTIRPGLVVLDTLADLFPGNENDRTQVRQFVGLARKIAIAHHCAIVVLAHPSLSGLANGRGTSGSTAWNNSVRSRLNFVRVPDDPDARKLMVEKSNYGPTGGEIEVTWKDGVFIAQSVSTTAGENRFDAIVLRLVADLAAQGTTYTRDRAPGKMEGMPGTEGLRRPAIKKAIDRLFSAGRLTNKDVRENGKIRSIIAINESFEGT